MLAPFIYEPEKSIEVYEQSIDYLKEEKILNRIQEIGWAYHAIGGVIPHTEANFWSGHFFPWLESWEDLQISFNLALFGLYKQAMISIRSGSELGLMSVYWNLNDDGHQVIKDWLRSDEDTPRLTEIWDKLVEHKNFQKFKKNYDLKQKLLDLNYLHNWVHTKGYKYSNYIGIQFKSNHQTFEKKGIKIWLESFEEVIKILSICHLVKYPIGTVEYDWSKKFGIDVPSFGGLNSGQIKKLKSLIDKDTFNLLKEVAKQDEHVVSLVKSIKSMPDVTEEQKEKQIRDFNKRFIEKQGFNNWLENEKEKMKLVDEVGEKWKKRIDDLRQWAKNNGYEKSIWERKEEE